MTDYPTPARCRGCSAQTAWRHRLRRDRTVVLVLLAGVLATAVRAQPAAPAPDVRALKDMSLDELMAVEVTSVSRRPEKLSSVASAIQVISGDDIARSTATRLPDALRLLSNVRVAQVNSYGWVVTTRGFSNIFANKLLVLVDGRTVYTPLFAGVFWDVQDVLLNDLDRVEAISGPGGTLWGANAVNGVINITSKSARDTQGGLVSLTAGAHLEDAAAVRYGGKVGANLYYRVFAQTSHHGPTETATGGDAADAWTIDTAGARLDWYPTQADTLTLQGSLYDGREHTVPAADLTGAHVIGRWTRQTSSDAEVGVQVYHDRSWRKSPADLITDELETYDLDFHHRFAAGARHNVVWGAGYRFMRSTVRYDTPLIAFLPPTRNMDLFSAFALDEIAVVPERLALTVGSKLEHNFFSGWDAQPSVRLAFSPDEHQTVWTSVSRAIRAPSRIDVDYHLPGTDIAPGTPGVDGGPNFGAERVIAYEAGYRVQPAPSVQLSTAIFYNRYDDLYSVEALPGTPTYQIQNGAEGRTWGAELSAEWRPVRSWRLRAGYTYFREHLQARAGHVFDTTLLANDPRHQWLLHSILDLPAHLQLDVTLRSVAALPRPRVDGYTVADIRVGWAWTSWEVAVAAQNLGSPSRYEFGGQVARIPREVYGRISYCW